MPRVDVHIVIGPNEPWLTECVQSLMHEDVHIWFVPKVDGNTAAAREAGFRKGTAEYVSFVDPDDLIMPGIFAKCVHALDNHPHWVGVYTDEVLIDRNGAFIMNGWSVDHLVFEPMGYCHELMQGVHHLRVLRRSVVEKCLPLKTKRIPEPVLMHQLRQYGVLRHLFVVGYQWRVHGQNTFLSYTIDELNEAIEYVRAIGPAGSI